MVAEIESAPAATLAPVQASICVSSCDSGDGGDETRDVTSASYDSGAREKETLSVAAPAGGAYTGAVPTIAVFEADGVSIEVPERDGCEPGAAESVAEAVGSGVEVMEADTPGALLAVAESVGENVAGDAVIGDTDGDGETDGVIVNGETETEGVKDGETDGESAIDEEGVDVTADVPEGDTDMVNGEADEELVTVTETVSDDDGDELGAVLAETLRLVDELQATDGDIDGVGVKLFDCEADAATDADEELVGDVDDVAVEEIDTDGDIDGEVDSLNEIEGVGNTLELMVAVELKLTLELALALADALELDIVLIDALLELDWAQAYDAVAASRNNLQTRVDIALKHVAM